MKKNKNTAGNRRLVKNRVNYLNEALGFELSWVLVPSLALRNHQIV